MGKWLRRIRGAIGMGLTWAVAWLAAGRRRFDQMSLPRFAVWGGVGGLLLSVILVLATGLGGEALLGLGAIFGLSGAGCAAGSLALARMAEDRELLDASADVGEAGLTEDEERELLGGGG